MPWCKYFVPKIATPGITPNDPELNENIMYAKCIRGHVLKNADDWLLCENLPAPDALCWQEGGQTLLTLGVRQRGEAQNQDTSPATRQENRSQTTRS